MAQSPNTAQYKKVLMKDPTPIMAGKVLRDNDDDEEDYEDDDMDEQSPHCNSRLRKMVTRGSNEDVVN